MLRASARLTAVLVPVFLAGCSEGGPVGPGEFLDGPDVALSQHGSAASLVDVSGAWTWTSVEVLRMPTHVAAMVGIDPEGPNTHARCESAGSMTLAQTGAAFEGTATREANACLTRGGQSFQQPGVALWVSDGRITGGSVRFSFATATVTPCPHQAVISSEEGGLATALRGRGRCVIPGHPLSESPIVLDPPPGGTSTTLVWEAARP